MSTGELGAGGRILVVDDAIENVRVLHAALKGEHEILFALDGEKALAVAREQAPDLILLDAVMPGLDGFATCVRLKQESLTRDVPVIFVSGLTSPEDEARALETGAVDFISKPVNAAVVRARVRTHLTLKRQSDMLREMAQTDGLTGVANRRLFDETLEKEWRRCARNRNSIALIMADVDHFKAYNDHYGHQAGDVCLIAVAQALSRCVRRPPDLVARYGGEEFVVLLPQDDLAGAEAVAGRMLELVRGLEIPHATSRCAPEVTVSLGVAALAPCLDLSPSVLVRAADTCLYAAKSAGRNRYCADAG